MLANKPKIEAMQAQLVERGKDGRTWYDIAEEFGLSYQVARSHGLDSVGLFEAREERKNSAAGLVPDGYEITGGRTSTRDGVNFSFRPVIDRLTPEGVAEVIEGILERVPVRVQPAFPDRHDTEMVNITDVHVGMSTEYSLFDQEWHEKKLFERFTQVVQHQPENCNMVINMLGDYADGERGRTASNSVTLEQNMTDQNIFRVGLDAFMYFITETRLRCKGKIVVNWVSNSNHPTVVDHHIGIALQRLCWAKFDDVVINILDAPYNVGKFGPFDLILTHGKDRKYQKRGLPRFIKETQEARIQRYVLEMGLQNPLLLRGDLHQYHDVDYSMFRDIMTPAFCPPSGWAATNFLTKSNGGYTRVYIEDGTVVVKEFKFDA